MAVVPQLDAEKKRRVHQIVTLPKWECRAPAAFRRRSKGYWCCAEQPLSDEWISVINTVPDVEMQLPRRSIIAVSTAVLGQVLQ